ncbi:MAG: family 20 glycosylhydrolase [Clostridia bacterium]|nr:family 20 glycosylhydrolase [Clostridia bacterium]
MYIGKLNYTAPALPMTAEWGTLWERPLKLILALEQQSFVDRITLRFGENTQLTAVSVAGYAAHTAETGKHITEREITLQVNALCEKLDLSIQADYTDIELLDLTVFGAIMEGIALFPTPDRAETDGRRFPAANYPTFSAELPLKAEAVLAEKWAEETGLTLQKAEKGTIRFVKGDLPANGYTLSVTEAQITLTASDERGFVIAAETLIKLLKDGTLPACTITDAPAHPFRGVHLYLPAADQVDFAKRLVKYLLSPMGYNAAIIEIAGGMKFDSHPLINQKTEEAIEKGNAGIWPSFPHGGVAGGRSLEKETVREFVDYIRSFGIEVIPEIQSLGHVQFMTQAYPEIAELDQISETLTDTRAEDTRPNKFYKHCYCPSNPRSYEILFDLMDEIIEVFRPTEYVHMGHDEVYEIGVCKICRSKDPARLLADDINKIYDYLQKKGLKMMIWADMLQPRKNGRLTHPAADRIPKDILMLDFIWYFHPEEDIEDHLLEKGFKVAVGNLYSSHYPRYNSRIAKPGMVGGQISAWVQTKTENLAQEGKLFDFRLTAQMLWSKAYAPEYTNVYTDMILKGTPALREKLESITLPSLHGEGERLSDPAAIHKTGKSLRIRHMLAAPVTKEPWKKGPKVGEYLLTYADGTQQRYELFSGWNIAMDRRPYGPNPHKLYRHTGYAADYYCTPSPLGGQVIEIPLMEKELSSVRLIQEPGVLISHFDTEMIK